MNAFYTQKQHSNYLIAVVSIGTVLVLFHAFLSNGIYFNHCIKVISLWENFPLINIVVPKTIERPHLTLKGNNPLLLTVVLLLVIYLISAFVLPGLSDESGNRVATFYIRLRLGYEHITYPYRHVYRRTDLGTVEVPFWNHR